jgi:glycosyltransferase involved in cell wall biosynthesis
MSTKPSVSIVVPVYNEELLLADSLASLQQQDYTGDCEIILVDNGSTDRSAEIARAMGARVVKEPRKGVVHALHTGYGAVQSDIIASTDADTRVPADWVSRLVVGLTKQSDVVAVGGIYTFYDSPAWLRWATLLTNQLDGQLLGMNMAMWRWAYESIGGIDTSVNLGWDAEVGRQLQSVGRVVIDRKIVVETSARRYQSAGLWSSLLRYRINDWWLAISGKPLFYDFSDIRNPTRSQPVRSWAVIVVAAVVLAWLLGGK